MRTGLTRSWRTVAACCAAAVLSLGAGAVTVSVDGACLGLGSVTWKASADQGGRVRLTLTALPADGAVFSGWKIVDRDFRPLEDLRQSELASISLADEASVIAYFLPVQNDCLSFDFTGLGDDLIWGEPIEEDLFIDSESYPVLSFAGLPPGLSFDPRRQVLYGTPTEPGLYRVRVEATNAGGFRYGQTIVMRVGNRFAERTSGNDLALVLGDYRFFTFDELFTLDENWRVISVSGEPPGMTWDDATQLFYGTPTKTGSYTVSATVGYDAGPTETATMQMTVAAPEPFAYGLDLAPLEGLVLGDTFAPGDCPFSELSPSVEILSITGLPPGLRVGSWTEGRVTHRGIVGTVLADGLYDLALEIRPDGSEASVRVEQTITVANLPQQCVVAVPHPFSPAGAGTVTGGGPKSVIEPVVLTATPARGYVFAGWYDDLDLPLACPGGVDYRSATLDLPAGFESLTSAFYARFVTAAEDRQIVFEALEDIEFGLDAEHPFEETFAVDSLSLPRLTVEGLPAGVRVVTGEGGNFAFVFDPETSASPEPGYYEVTVTASNASGATARTTCWFVVANRTDPRVYLDDDFGEFVPDEEIDPIDLSFVVDFEAGESITVSGLPKGLVYHSKATDPDVYTITGTPTEPGHYTIRVKAKVLSEPSASGARPTLESVTVTAFMHILPHPQIAVEMDDDAFEAGNRVTGTGRFRVGTQVVLKARPAKGWAFAGWEWVDDLYGLAAKHPTLKLTVSEELNCYARFVRLSEDALQIDAPPVDEHGYAFVIPAGTDVRDLGAETFIEDLIVSESYPHVTVRGLPRGLHFWPSRFALEGAPAVPGVYPVTITARNASGYRFVRVFTIAVSDAGGSVPSEPDLPNGSALDFAPFVGLKTGLPLAADRRRLVVGRHPVTGASVSRVSLTGLPPGLKRTVRLANGEARIELSGWPSQAGRTVVTVRVFYHDGKSELNRFVCIVEDSGSAYLSVDPLGPGSGSVSGAGVYAAGSKVRLSARAFAGSSFNGWSVSDWRGETFAPLEERIGEWISVKGSKSLSFIFYPQLFEDIERIVAAFGVR